MRGWPGRAGAGATAMAAGQPPQDGRGKGGGGGNIFGKGVRKKEVQKCHLIKAVAKGV